MPMIVRRTSLRLAAASLCVLQLLFVEAAAHVRVPDVGHVGRNAGPGDPATPGPGSGKHKPVCDASLGGRDLSAVSVRSATETSINTAELLSLLSDDDTTPDIVRVAQGMSADGSTCPLFVTLATGP